ncbi:MAG: hypothetical protein DRO89_00010 [Candidatus Altiarchaeales archaeon]|nr:MAG: hypothetical protein DRO89_00010 [Candidatus Altiarchaeales archaeon]
MVKEGKKVRIDEKKNRVTVTFDTRFYEPESIRLSVNDFRDCCSAKLKSEDGKITVVLSPKSKEIDINTLGYEFYNYVLGRMRSSESRF